jgi:GST-like protein
MIQLYSAPTPNGWKVSILLEELGLPYRFVPIRLDLGEQLTEEFTQINPNGRIPALVDPEPVSGPPVTIFESGAILLYLAEKTGQFLPLEPTERFAVIQWLMWQMAGLGPMVGQNAHFLFYAPERLPYAVHRYSDEVRRLYQVLDRQLGKTADHIAGAYSIADMACFPWIITHKKQGLSLDDYPHLQRWFTVMRARPQVQRGLEVGGGVKGLATLSVSDLTKRQSVGLNQHEA